MNRWLQYSVYLAMIFGFFMAILAGWLGTPVGSRNFGIVFTWIAWWAILILVAVPFLGRGWCSVCPIPLAGEWVQRGGVMTPPKNGTRGFSLHRRWPKFLRNIWLQNVAFTLVALFSSIILTTPRVSSIVLMSMVFVSFGLSLIYERRTFCRYVCPVSGFIGLYSQTSPVELRVSETSVCAQCKEKPCYRGSSDGFGCPWDVFPGGMSKNTSCGLCLECLRTCPNDNVVLRTRPFGDDLVKPVGRKMDEAFKAFIMLGAALIYSAVLLGPWGGLKLAAYSIGSLDWLLYVVGFILIMYILLPGIFLGTVWLGKKLGRSSRSLKREFIRFSYILIPLGLMAWIAFSLSFAFTNAAYVISTLSDPFGWGWNLFGTSTVSWSPFLGGIVPLMQAGVLLVGLAWSINTAYKISLESSKGSQALLQALPSMFFGFTITIGFLVLLL